MNNIQDCFLSLPISAHHRDIARSLGNQQLIPQVAERLRRNSLAVLLVHDYLEMMGIDSNYETSDCWNPVVQICADIADLDITGLGKIECRSLQIDESSCYVPPEVWEERIGYVVMRLEKNWRSATLLGFVSKVSTEFIALNRLEPIENLCVAIAALRESSHQNSISNETIVSLSNWLQNLFESSWEEIENLLNSKQSQYAYRTREISRSLPNNLANLTEVRRGKLIDFGFQMAECLVALIITIAQNNQNEVSIRIAVYPISDVFLPEFLKLMVLNDEGNVFLQAQSRSVDNYIQMQLSGSTGERFSIQVSLAESCFVENFIV